MDLIHSYAFCKKVAKKEAKNFYYGIRTLPKPKRNALYALYAYMRHCDDMADNADDPLIKKKNIDQWREMTQKALSGTFLDYPEMPAFADAVYRYQIPHHYFFELIDGVEMDITPRRFEHFSDLYQYCYRVASVVGLCCLYVYGFEDETAKSKAIDCGIAFQLTNILRDIKEDASKDRIYIPIEDLNQFAYSEKELKQGILNQAFDDLMEFQFKRAKDYYELGKLLIKDIEQDSQFSLRTIIAIYENLLNKLSQNHKKILSGRISLTLREKLAIVLKSLLVKSI